MQPADHSEERPNARSLKLTPSQLQVLLETTSIAGQLKAKIELAGNMSEEVAFTEYELHKLNFKVESAIIRADASHKRLLSSVKSQIQKLLRATPPKPAARRITELPETALLYQFKITLCDTNPAIWRRIQIHDCTLDKLHEHIQCAMGWTNSHLHLFEFNGTRYGNPMLLSESFGEWKCRDSTRIKLSNILSHAGKPLAFGYEYDFGDGWKHDVLFEGNPKPAPKLKYPLCLEGERACPPEDCGGVWGYLNVIEALSDKHHPEHKDMRAWIGRRFHPETFDAKKASKEMSKGLSDRREML